MKLSDIIDHARASDDPRPDINSALEHLTAGQLAELSLYTQTLVVRLTVDGGMRRMDMDAYLAISQRIGESLAAQVYGAPPCDAHLPDIVDRLYTAIYATQGKRVARKALGRIVTKVVRMTRGRGAGPEHDDSQDDL